MDDELIERAAKKLCEIRGLDPDESVPHGHPEGYASIVYSKQWELLVPEIRSHLQVEEAIQVVQDM